jgi:hypothetical protein
MTKDSQALLYLLRVVFRNPLQSKIVWPRLSGFGSFPREESAGLKCKDSARAPSVVDVRRNSNRLQVA